MLFRFSLCITWLLHSRGDINAAVSCISETQKGKDLLFLLYPFYLLSPFTGASFNGKFRLRWGCLPPAAICVFEEVLCLISSREKMYLHNGRKKRKIRKVQLFGLLIKLHIIGLILRFRQYFTMFWRLRNSQGIGRCWGLAPLTVEACIWMNTSKVI